MAKYLKIYLDGRYTDETRDTREMLAAKEAGYNVCVMCKSATPFAKRLSQEKHVDANGFEINEITLKYWRAYRAVETELFFAFIARDYHADVISCHDINALKIGYMAVMLSPKGRRPKLVYDAHEFEPGRNSTRLQRETERIVRQEKHLMNRCALSIVVNDSIADDYQRMYALKERPLVVRSTPFLWQLDEQIITERRKELTDKLGVPENAFILMYHGGLMTNRGIENIIECVSRCRDIVMVFMGSAQSDEYQGCLEKLAAEKGASERILFIQPVPPDRIWEYAGAASCGIHITLGFVKNHFYNLPNKFFENIQSETPMITSNYPEMKRLIDKYDIGLTCDPENLEEVCACIKRMKDDKALYARFKENIKTAKRELCWENEKKPLIEALKKLAE